MAKRSTIDDGFQGYLVEGASFEGKDGIPRMLDLNNIDIPEKLVLFSKTSKTKDKRGYVHFYQHDRFFNPFLNDVKKHIGLLSQFDGVITPDPTIIIGKSRCLHVMSTYRNRAVGFYLQKQGIPVIPNIRWGDESTYEFCFLGVPKHSIVAISTLGCIQRDRSSNNFLRECFAKGLKAMLEYLEPNVVLVHGYMPEDLFGIYAGRTKFVRYPSEIEKAHGKEAI